MHSSFQENNCCVNREFYVHSLSKSTGFEVIKQKGFVYCHNVSPESLNLFCHRSFAPPALPTYQRATYVNNHEHKI